MNEPTKIQSGLNIEWTEFTSDYSAADGWTLKYRLFNSVGKVDISSAADGANHKVTLAAAITAAYIAGDYSWLSYVEKGADKIEIARGYIKIVEDVLSMAAFDFRSENRKTYELLLTAQQNWAANGEAVSISIGGRNVNYRSFDELKSAIATYKQLVYNEELEADIASGKRKRPRILRQFGTD